MCDASGDFLDELTTLSGTAGDFKLHVSSYLKQFFNIQIKNRLEILETKEPPERPSGIKVSSVDELIEKLKNEVGVI